MLTFKTFTFNPVQENTYVIYNDQAKCCIIDPGCYFPEERTELKGFIERTGLEPVLLLNTHCHLDHVFGNKFVHDTWNLDLHIHPKEKKLLDHAPDTGNMWQLPFENYEGEIVYIKENTQLKLGEEMLDILFTPGHSPGSVSFYSAADGFVISGDVLFNGSIGRTDIPGGNYDVLINSIRTQLFPLPDETKVLSGHGPETTIGNEKLTNPFLQN